VQVLTVGRSFGYLRHWSHVYTAGARNLLSRLGGGPTCKRGVLLGANGNHGQFFQVIYGIGN